MSRAASFELPRPLMLKAGFSMLLRGAGLVCKFVLVLAMARWLDPAEVGRYGLLALSLGLLLNLAAFEYYAHSTRELLAEPPWRLDFVVWQGLLHGVLYGVATVLSLGFYLFHFLEWNVFFWLIGLLVLEHLSLEAYRLCLTLDRQVEGNTVMFFRTGGWVLVLLPLQAGFPALRTLPVVYLAWGAGDLVALGYAFTVLRRAPWYRAKGPEDGLAWIRRGLWAALPFWGTSILVRLTASVDRFFLQKFVDPATLGIYTFFLSNNTAIISFVDAALVGFFMPRFARLGPKGDPAEVRAEERRFGTALLLLVALLALGSLAAIRPLLLLLDRPLYLHFIYLHWLLLASVCCMVLGFWPQLSLYRQRRDRHLFGCSVLTLAAGLVLNAVLVPRFHAAGAALASLGTALTGAILKLYVAWKPR